MLKKCNSSDYFHFVRHTCLDFFSISLCFAWICLFVFHVSIIFFFFVLLPPRFVMCVDVVPYSVSSLFENLYESLELRMVFSFALRLRMYLKVVTLMGLQLFLVIFFSLYRYNFDSNGNNKIQRMAMNKINIHGTNGKKKNASKSF